ncbi:MAG: hypothetical protein IKN71_03320 [Alphaproteobacteria bacterium]|nr:hypothetical protein [Alphaproteobacteria bacterium]
MSVMDYLNRKHKVMNCVFEILYDLYGEPTWLRKPKDGQEPEKIIEQWIAELSSYSEVQLRQACYNLFKYKKVATFPKLAHLLAELSDQEKECEQIQKQNNGTPHYFSIEQELMQRDIDNKCCIHIMPVYRDAAEYVLSKMLKDVMGAEEYANLEQKYKNDWPLMRGKKYRKAMELGLFNNFDKILDKISKERSHG